MSRIPSATSIRDASTPQNMKNIQAKIEYGNQSSVEIDCTSQSLVALSQGAAAQRNQENPLFFEDQSNNLKNRFLIAKKLSSPSQLFSSQINILPTAAKKQRQSSEHINNIFDEIPSKFKPGYIEFKPSGPRFNANGSLVPYSIVGNPKIFKNQHTQWQQQQQQQLILQQQQQQQQLQTRFRDASLLIISQRQNHISKQFKQKNFDGISAINTNPSTKPTESNPQTPQGFFSNLASQRKIPIKQKNNNEKSEFVQQTKDELLAQMNEAAIRIKNEQTKHEEMVRKLPIQIKILQTKEERILKSHSLHQETWARLSSFKQSKPPSKDSCDSSVGTSILQRSDGFHHKRQVTDIYEHLCSAQSTANTKVNAWVSSLRESVNHPDGNSHTTNNTFGTNSPQLWWDYEPKKRTNSSHVHSISKPQLGTNKHIHVPPLHVPHQCESSLSYLKQRIQEASREPKKETIYIPSDDDFHQLKVEGSSVYEKELQSIINQPKRYFSIYRPPLMQITRTGSQTTLSKEDSIGKSDSISYHKQESDSSGFMGKSGNLKSNLSGNESVPDSIFEIDTFRGSQKRVKTSKSNHFNHS